VKSLPAFILFTVSLLLSFASTAAGQGNSFANPLGNPLGATSLGDSSRLLSSEPSVLLDQLNRAKADQSQLQGRIKEIEHGLGVNYTGSMTDVFNGYMSVFVVAFLTTLCVTPIFRKLAITYGIIDRPDEARKHHKFPIAYLGGVAVYSGIIAAIGFSYFAPLHGLITFHKTTHLPPTSDLPYPVPMSILFGMTIVMLIGLWDDVAQVSPLQKIGGQLLAAAALAMNDVGVKVAKQVLSPIGELLGNPELLWSIPLPFALPMVGDSFPIDAVYWSGTLIIAFFVLGACNASNLIDGLDGLLSGVTAICAGGLLMVALGMAMYDNGQLDSARIILCLALMGACMGFLPHNFNPATIFLGDSGSLLLGYTTIVIVLMLGDTGQTNLVLAGLIIYAIPMLDTSLAIVRRKLSGQRISAADDQHLHHILKRKLGVKGAVFSLYGMGVGFAALGILLTLERGRITYALTIVLVSFIAVIAFKVARRKQFEEAASKLKLGTGQGDVAAQQLAASEARPTVASFAEQTTSSPSMPMSPTSGL